MLENNEVLNKYLLSDKEISTVDKYRKLRETSVLTIMFTDIKGFTSLTEEKGESFSINIRQTHDSILVPIIEENNEGLIVKHIGDSIMAVFSEPSTAVARAIKIQQELNRFNHENPDKINIEIRIGLHMGQVTVENNINLDLFGRHVNRASRVEGLADGGQIYMTYPIFDSAKGWLSQHLVDSVIWKKHGGYFLKGIKEPIDIYEVTDSKINKPKPPVSGKKKRIIPPLGIAFLLLLIGAAITISVMQFQKTSVWLVDFWPTKVYFNKSGEKLNLDNNLPGKTRKVLNKVKSGDYVLYYNVSRMVRYYASVNIKRGKNYIKPDFKEYRLPGSYRTLSLNKKNNYEDIIPVSRIKNYSIFNNKNKEIFYKTEINYSIKGKRTSTNPDEFTFTVKWTLNVNGNEVSADKKTATSTEKESFVIYEDELHYYEVVYNIGVGTNRNNANFEIRPGFKKIIQK
ncbi:MAG: adenylate/guanylate cyclase domain-containing protein [Candidatus Cloacimonetes bacterium]|nr:adenylate/guanylate cyclase domain-containing protein [Candidatus Cloacimonadota bacterium]